MAFALAPFLSLCAQVVMNVLHWHLCQYVQSNFLYKYEGLGTSCILFVQVCSFFNAKEGNLWLFKISRLLNKLFLTNCWFSQRMWFSWRRHLEDDVLYTYFPIFTLVLITKQNVGFDRHGYCPLFANPYKSQTNWVI